MATPKESITTQKDIQINDFSDGNAASNSAVFNHSGSEPFCKVFVHPACRSDPEFVSVRVRRCSFYPRFFPGVVYGSLGWKVSVVDDEGAEKFVSYFGHDGFQGMDWAEDFFAEGRGYELKEFVKRSVLVGDPERFLPGGVLTVRVEMFYECRSADESVAMETRGEDIQAFVIRPFLQQQVALAEKERSGTKSDAGESECSRPIGDSDGLVSAVEELSIEGKEGYWKKESVLMMEETFQELKDGFELYAKLQQLKDIVERTPQPVDSKDDDFCPDPFTDMDLFMGLYTEVGLGPPMDQDFLSWMEEIFGVAKVSQQLARVLAVHKHFQVHLEKGRKVEDEKFGEGASSSSHACAMSEGIRELFVIYGETKIRPEKSDPLMVRVNRFLKVFSNVLRILSLRLYWPVCVHQQPPPSATSDDNTSVPSTNDEMSSSLEGSSDPDPTWIFTVETSDGEQFRIPFRTGATTLGSLLRAASPVFDRMLDTPMLERSTGFVKIDDVDSAAFSRFLAYLERGVVDVESLQSCGELYRLAHKYRVEGLVLRCTEKMAAMMEHADADDVAEFSRFYGDDALMSRVEAFRFRPRATMAAWGLAELDAAPLSSETTWAKSVEGVPVVEKAIQAVQPKEKYEFYE